MSWDHVNDIRGYCQELTVIKPDFVVVGSMAMVIHGLYSAKPNDLDVVVNDLQGFSGDLHTYFTYSRFSSSGNRAYILENGMAKIDIFVENTIPYYEIIDNIRVSTVQSMLLYYQNLLPKVAEHWKTGILEKIKVLSYGK